MSGSVITGPWQPPERTPEQQKEEWLRRSKVSKAAETRRRNKARLKAADELARACSRMDRDAFTPQATKALADYWLASSDLSA